MCNYLLLQRLLNLVNKYAKLIDLFTFILEYIMSIIGDATKDNICESGVPCVDFLGLYIEPVLIRHKTAPENIINREKIATLLLKHRVL